tara:strand:- start:9738 stop:10151 length:414 start_codon:yes stop_codon:yes gene_type:complete
MDKSKKLRKVPKDKKTGIPKKYVPKSLSEEDRKKQIESIKKGTKRPKVDFDSKRSSFVVKFEKKYGYKINNFSRIDKEIIKKKGIDLIMDKGRGAYFSGGSRPNQTPQSWSLARLASVIMGGKARKVDKDIWDKYKR